MYRHNPYRKNVNDEANGYITLYEVLQNLKCRDTNHGKVVCFMWLGFNLNSAYQSNPGVRDTDLIIQFIRYSPEIQARINGDSKSKWQTFRSINDCSKNLDKRRMDTSYIKNCLHNNNKDCKYEFRYTPDKSGRFKVTRWKIKLFVGWNNKYRNMFESVYNKARDEWDNSRVKETLKYKLPWEAERRSQYKLWEYEVKKNYTDLDYNDMNNLSNSKFWTLFPNQFRYAFARRSDDEMVDITHNEFTHSHDLVSNISEENGYFYTIFRLSNRDNPSTNEFFKLSLGGLYRTIKLSKKYYDEYEEYAMNDVHNKDCGKMDKYTTMSVLASRIKK